MGYEYRTIEVGVTLKRDNVQNDADDARLAELRARILAVCDEYQDIAAWVV